jgi:CheY-like chemotaxis protein
MMTRKYTILIADNNIHVRRFLVRELSGPSYEIIQAANHMQLFSRIFGEKTPDLIVFDLNIPYINCLDVLKQLLNITPPIPVIIYSYLSEYKDHPLVKNTQGFVEKDGNISTLQNKISEVLIGYYENPDRSGQGHQDYLL